ncbi:MAG: hypothetical protein AAB584_00805 [Patescibacteria group bacterium]
MNRNLLVIIILIVFFAGVIVFLRNRGEREEIGFRQTTATPTQQQVSLFPSPPLEYVIDMIDSGFNPAEIVINAGNTVRFINQSSQGHWPASAVHPTHEFYPGSSISKCNSPGSMTIFDACRGLQKGESFSFTFNEKGTWPYHDHLAPSAKGKIIVR